MNHHESPYNGTEKGGTKKTTTTIIITVWHFFGTNHDEPNRIRNLSGNPVETINPVVKLVDWFSEANFANSHGYSSTPHGPIRSISKMIRLQFSLKNYNHVEHSWHFMGQRSAIRSYGCFPHRKSGWTRALYGIRPLFGVPQMLSIEWTTAFCSGSQLANLHV